MRNHYTAFEIAMSGLYFGRGGTSTGPLESQWYWGEIQRLKELAQAEQKSDAAENAALHAELAEAKGKADEAIIELSKESENSAIWFDRATTQKIRADETAYKLERVRAALETHRLKAFASCEEDCFCWDIDAALQSEAPAPKKE